MLKVRYEHAAPDDTGANGPAAGGGSGEPAEANQQQPESTGEQAPAESEKPTASWISDTPGDWREQIAGEDESYLNALKRHSDLKSVLKSGWEAQQRIRKGEISNGLPENPTEEQMAEWRSANGVPESPDQYKIDLEEGVVLGEQDSRVLESVRKVAHEANVPAETLSRLTNAMLQGKQAEAEARQQQDGVDQQTAVRVLKDTWSQDYETNVNLVKGFVSQLPESVREAFASARLPDGKAMFNSPEVMIYFSDIMRKVNPAATVVPNSNNPMQAINDEIKTLEAKMGTREWFKDTAAQKRYQDLITARDNMQ